MAPPLPSPQARQAHQIKTSLHIARGYLDLGIKEIEHMSRLVDQQCNGEQSYSKEVPRPFSFCEMRSLLDVTMSEFKCQDKSRHFLIRGAWPKGSVLINPQSIKELFRILFENALQHSPPGSKVLVLLGHQGERWFLEMSNPVSEIKTPGHGLGLQIARHITELHRGRIDILEGKHYRVRLEIPPQNA